MTEQKCVICGEVVTRTSYGSLTQTCRREECLSAIRSMVAKRNQAERRRQLARRTTRTCGVCGQRLPLTEEHFDLKRDPATGEVKFGLHKPCRRVWQRLAYREHDRTRRLERLAQRWREEKARREADPEYNREYLERRRRYIRNSQKGQRGIVDEHSPIDREHAGYLPAAPFVEWLDRAYASADFEGSRDDFCEALGVSARNVSRARSGEQTLISLDTVDRALINEGGGTFLWDLYPHLYEMEEVA